MKRRDVLTAVAGAALVPVASKVQAQASSPQTITFRIQTGVPAASLYFDLMKKFADRIGKMSSGRLKAEVLPDGAVVGFFDILDAVHKGVVEAGFAWTHFWSGKNSAAYLFSNPAASTGMDQLSHMAWYLHGGGYELYQKFYAEVLKFNVEGFLMQPMGPDPFGWFKRPIKNLEDFKKLKYRSPPGITGEIFKEMGASPVALPGGEIVPSAQRGVIDAAEWIGPADDMNLGLYTVWKNYYLQGLHQATDVGEILFSKTFWNKLPADLQEIIKGAIIASMMETYTYGNIHKNALAIKALRDEHGVKLYDTPKDFYPAFIAAANKILDKYAAINPFFNEVLTSQRKFAENVVPWRTKILELYATVGQTAEKKMQKK